MITNCYLIDYTNNSQGLWWMRSKWVGLIWWHCNYCVLCSSWNSAWGDHMVVKFTQLPIHWYHNSGLSAWFKIPLSKYWGPKQKRETSDCVIRPVPPAFLFHRVSLFLCFSQYPPHIFKLETLRIWQINSNDTVIVNHTLYMYETLATINICFQMLKVLWHIYHLKGASLHISRQKSLNVIKTHNFK